MKPKYKSKMRQKQWERSRTNRAESKESNKPKTMTTEQIRKLWERLKVADIRCGEWAGSHVY
jgi:hypothetical protein